jgi:hypothetical protein
MHTTTTSAGSRLAVTAAATILGFTLTLAPGAALLAQDGKGIVIARQGSFMVGGTVVTNPGTFDPVLSTPEGQTFHGDHAYVQFQIPVERRRLPLVLWHGGGQFSKTWESTPDGRDGFQTIFLRRGFPVYILDQPRRGRAGRSTVGTELTPLPGSGATGEQGIFVRFRIGIWPDYFPGVSFPRDSASLDQWWRQQTPNTGPEDQTVVTDAGAALFEKIGPAVLVSHSASGVHGWLTAIKSSRVKAVVSYEPVTVVFPEGEVPPPIGATMAQAVPPEDFERLTRIPIQIIYGDNIPEEPHPIPNLDIWRTRMEMAQLFVDKVNEHGGDATLLHLPDVGIFGNTHFPMSDLNNREVADQLSRWLRQKGLDQRVTKD